MLLFTASEIETATVSMGVNPAVAGLLGGMGGGIAQAYATMGEFKKSHVTARIPLTPPDNRFLHMHEDS